MRIWDIEPEFLCQKHLVAEHRELHGLWNILTKHKAKGGYSRHPETLRWVGKQKALYNRHEALIKEFFQRKYQHHTPLDKKLAIGRTKQAVFINTLAEQKRLLRNKPCDCFQAKKKAKKIAISAFARKVYSQVKKIPKGKVASYAWVAKKIGCPGAVRAVGNALNKNPYAPAVPCHRVIRSDRKIGGFARGEDKKIELLKKEGVVIKNSQVGEDFILK